MSHELKPTRSKPDKASFSMQKDSNVAWAVRMRPD